MTRLNRAKAHLRQLCSSKLPIELLSPAIAESLNPIVGNSCALFLRARPDGSTKDIWLNRPAPFSILNNYLNQYADRPRQAVFEGQKHGLFHYFGVRFLPDWKEFYENDYYRAIWRPLDMHFALSMYLRLPRTPMAIGNCIIYRSRNEGRFSRCEVSTLLDLVPHIAGAFAAHAVIPDTSNWIDSEEHGLVIERNGQLTACDVMTQHLLFQMSSTLVTPNQRLNAREIILNLAKRLRKIFSGGDSLPAVTFLTNAHGRFVIRAHWLDNQPEGLVAIAINKEIPTDLHMIQCMQSLPLSPMQKEVCFLAAKNASYKQIASTLGISPNTVKDHLRKVYTNLDISDNNALTSLLRSPKSRLNNKQVFDLN